MKFFVLKNPHTNETTFVTDFILEEGFAVGPASRCPACDRPLSMLPLMPPIRVELEAWGKGFGDIAFGSVNELLVSERFWELYLASGLTGLSDVGQVKVLKVVARKRQRESVPNYRCCRVTRSRTAIDLSKSGLDLDPPKVCSECRLGGIIKRTQRVIIEKSSWSGEDIFYARGLPGRIIVSQKFKDFCDLNQISNCLLIPAEEFSIDYYPWETKKKPVEPPSLN